MRVATWNMGPGESETKRDSLTRLAKAADVLALNEAGDHDAMISSWCKQTGWKVWFGDEPGSPSVPILWSPSVPVKRKGSRLAVPSRNVGAGAGPSESKPKAVNWVRVGKVDILATHFIASATRDGNLYDRRREHYRDHMAVLAGMIHHRIENGIRPLTLGDFNAPEDFNLLDPLRRLGLRQRVMEATLDFRIVDHIWTYRLPAPIDERSALELASDHRGAVVTVKEPT